MQVFDKTAKGYVLDLEGGRDVKVQLPAGDRESLGLLQHYLVLQVLLGLLVLGLGFVPKPETRDPFLNADPYCAAGVRSAG